MDTYYTLYTIQYTQHIQYIIYIYNIYIYTHTSSIESQRKLVKCHISTTTSTLTTTLGWYLYFCVF